MVNIWQSKTLHEWHWTFIPPLEGRDIYSGTAKTYQQAETDILASAQHYIQVHGCPDPA